MAEYKTGIRTKAIILSKAKLLFYNKGYTAASVKEICSRADVPVNSITYHFKGKENLAAQIYLEMLSKIVYLTRKNISHEEIGDQEYLWALIPHMIQWELLFQNKNILRFAQELYAAHIIQNVMIGSDQYDNILNEPFFEPFEHTFHVSFDRDYLNILRLSFLGIESELIQGIGRELNDLDKILRYVLKLRFIDLPVSNEEYEEIYRQCRALSGKMNINYKYFEKFAYNEKYLKSLISS